MKTKKPRAQSNRPCRVLIVCLITGTISGLSVIAADEQTGSSSAAPANNTYNEFRVQRPPQPADATKVGATPADGSASPLTGFQQNYNALQADARADLARIISPSKLLTADFQAVYDQEKSLEKEARKMSAQESEGAPDSMRVGRFGAHIIACNKCLQDCARYDTVYSAYLDACAAHFKQYHRPDLEMQMRHSPCGCNVLAVMGDDYAQLHHAVLQAHAERLKLLVLENTLRAQSGTQGSISDQLVKGKIMPANESH